MISILKVIVLTGLLAFSLVDVSMAADTPLEFEDQDKQQRYTELLEELRCLVCQNQSLSDSHAELAQDLRQEVYNLIQEGKNNKSVVDFLVARYGDFVLYKPPVKKSTWLLWFGPFALLMIGLISIYLFTRSSRQEEEKVLSEQAKERLANLLQQKDKK